MQRIIDLFICLSFYLYLLSTYIFHYYFRRMTLRVSSMLNQEQNASKIYFYSVFQKIHLPPIFFAILPMLVLIPDVGRSRCCFDNFSLFLSIYIYRERERER